jgi:hypothetical protein
MIEPLCPALTFEQCIDALADSLNVDMRPHSHDQRLLLVHYFAALVIGGKLPSDSHDGMGNTVLHYCARVGWAAGVSSVIGSGVFQDADDNSCGSAGMGDAAAVLQKNASGCTVLHCASVSTCLRTFNILVHCLADVLNDEYAVTGTLNQHDHCFVDGERRTLLHYTGG